MTAGKSARRKFVCSTLDLYSNTQWFNQALLSRVFNQVFMTLNYSRWANFIFIEKWMSLSLRYRGWKLLIIFFLKEYIDTCRQRQSIKIFWVLKSKRDKHLTMKIWSSKKWSENSRTFNFKSCFLMKHWTTQSSMNFTMSFILMIRLRCRS